MTTKLHVIIITMMGVIGTWRGVFGKLKLLHLAVKHVCLVATSKQQMVKKVVNYAPRDLIVRGMGRQPHAPPVNIATPAPSVASHAPPGIIVRMGLSTHVPPGIIVWMGLRSHAPPVHIVVL